MNYSSSEGLAAAKTDRNECKKKSQEQDIKPQEDLDMAAWKSGTEMWWGLFIIKHQIKTFQHSELRCSET